MHWVGRSTGAVGWCKGEYVAAIGRGIELGVNIFELLQEGFSTVLYLVVGEAVGHRLHGGTAKGGLSLKCATWCEITVAAFLNIFFSCYYSEFTTLYFTFRTLGCMFCAFGCRAACI